MYSRGWWIQPDYVGTPSIYASGGTTNGSALVRVIPAERLAVVVLANIGFLLDTVADAVVDEFVPAIRERRKTWTPPPPVTRQRRPFEPGLVGTWVGAIDTYRGKRPLTISIDASGTLTGSLGRGATEIGVTNGVTSGPRTFGRLPAADLAIEEAKTGSYDVQFSLEMYGSRLAGSATTTARTLRHCRFSWSSRVSRRASRDGPQ